MAITYKGNVNASGFSNPASITTGAFSEAVNAGDLIVCLVQPSGGTNTVSFSLTDNLNTGSYSNVVNSFYSAGAIQLAVYYMVCNATGSAGTTEVTAAFSGGTDATAERLYAVHYNGFVYSPSLIAADTTAVNSGDSTTASTTTFNNSQANELLLLFIGSTSGAITSNPSGWTGREVGSQIAIWDQNQTTIGNSISASLTLSSTYYWQAAVAGFYDAPPGAAIAWIT